MEENPTAGLVNEEEHIIDYDEDGNPIMPDKKVFHCSLLFNPRDQHSSFVGLLLCCK